MAEKYPLTEGALRLIMKGADLQDPIMQVLGSKRIASNSADKERYRLLLSDGKNVISFAMLTTQINNKVVSGELTDNSIIKVKRYITSVINNTGRGNKRVLVILEMETLLPGHLTTKIGNPEQLEDDDSDQKSPVKNGSTAAPMKNGQAGYNPPARNVVGNATLKYSNNDTGLLQDQLIHPISSLSPYQNKWVIKARVSNKSQIRKWSNSRGEGQLFSMDLIDESGEIRVTAFRDLVDKFYNMIEVGKVYYISKCQLKVANKQFTTIKNDYEMSMSNETIIQECHDADTSIPETQYDFLPIDKIAHIETGTLIDVIGVCKAVSELQTFQARSTGRELKKKEVTLVDQSNNAITLTLWGNDAEAFEGSLQPIVAVKGAKVGEFGGGKNISMVMGSILRTNPDLPESHRLRGWFDNGGMQQNVTNISSKSGVGIFQTPWLSFKEVQDQGLGNGDKGDYYQAKVTILLFRSENCIYKACPTEDCKKKVQDMQNGMYHCAKCNREYPNFTYRLLGSINVADWSGNQWVNMFSAEAETVLGMTAQQVGEAVENNPDALADITDRANFKEFIMKFRVKMENYNDESRLKTIVVKVEPINYKEYNAHLISKIQQLTS